MAKYQVEIIETSSRVVTQEADSYEEAQDIVEQKYDNSEIILDYEDLVDTSYRPYPSQKIKDYFTVQFMYNKPKQELIVSDKRGSINYSCKDYQELGSLLKEYFDNNIELEEVMPEIDVRKSKKEYER